MKVIGSGVYNFITRHRMNIMRLAIPVSVLFLANRCDTFEKQNAEQSYLMSPVNVENCRAVELARLYDERNVDVTIDRNSEGNIFSKKYRIDGNNKVYIFYNENGNIAWTETSVDGRKYVEVFDSRSGWRKYTSDCASGKDYYYNSSNGTAQGAIQYNRNGKLRYKRGGGDVYTIGKVETY